MLFFVFASDMIFYAGLCRMVPCFCLFLCGQAVAVRAMCMLAAPQSPPPCQLGRHCSSDLVVSALPFDGSARFEPGQEDNDPLWWQTDSMPTVLWSSWSGLRGCPPMLATPSSVFLVPLVLPFGCKVTQHLVSCAVFSLSSRCNVTTLIILAA